MSLAAYVLGVLIALLTIAAIAHDVTRYQPRHRKDPRP